MKKLLLIGAAVAAMIFASCSSEIGSDTGKGGKGEELKGKAYASFTFNLSSKGANTRAIGEYDPLGVAKDDDADKVIGYDDLYLLIFKDDPTGALEYTAKIDADGTGITSGHTHTVLLTAGNKKIFVLANLGDAANDNNVMANLLDGDDTTPVAITWDDIENLGTLSDFESVVFTAGTPQVHYVDKVATARSFSTLPLSTRVGGTSNLGLPMSNSNQYSFTLTANITEEQAEDTTITPSTSGSNSNNRFSIKLDYLGAKARLKFHGDLNLNDARPSGTTATNTTIKAKVSNPTYTIKNLAQYTNLIQNVAVSGGNADPQSYYHAFNWGAATQDVFDPHFDQALNLYTGPTATDYQNGLPVPQTAFSDNYIFVPENTHTLLLNGQSSFYAMHVTYKPQRIVRTVAHNPLANAGAGAIAFTAEGDWDTLAALAVGNAGRLQDGNKYYYYLAGISGGVENATSGTAPAYPVAYFFANERVFADALWVKANNKPMTDVSYSVAAADALLAALNSDPESGEIDYLIFTDASSYYRLDIGEGQGDDTDYGVLRGNAYEATINEIAGPGVPTEPDLFNDPELPVTAKTYINVTIEAADWTVVEQGGSVQ